MKFTRFLSYIIDLFIGYLPVCMISCLILVFFGTLLGMDMDELQAAPFLFMFLYVLPHGVIGMYIPALFSSGVNLLDILGMLSFLFIFIVSKAIYYTLSEILFKDTIGKRTTKVSVRDTNGFRISFSKRLLRNFLKSISEMILIPYIFYLFKKDDKVFYDKICETKVYDIRILKDHNK